MDGRGAVGLRDNNEDFQVILAQNLKVLEAKSLVSDFERNFSPSASI